MLSAQTLKAPLITDSTPSFTLTAESALLISWDTGRILYEKNAHRVYAIASLSKLMTIYLALEASEEGEFPLHEDIPLTPESYAENQELGSSLMFLGPDQQVSGIDLLRGLSVSSGNDAAVAVAIAISGSIAAFVEKMNQTARRLGYWSMRFADPAGLDPGNVASVYDLAAFASLLIARWEPRMPELFALRQFRYPEAHHHPGAMPILQYNRNLLLWDYPGADGLKTGYTESSGYTFIATAKRSGQRLIAVLLSVPGTSTAEGSRNRSNDARLLLDYGFDRFVTTTVPLVSASVPVSGGRVAAVTTQALYQPLLSLQKDDHARITTKAIPLSPLWAPLAKGEQVGKLVYLLDAQPLVIVPMVTLHEVERAGFFRRAWDWIYYHLSEDK